MSLKFVTRKLKTQKLEEQEQQQKLSDKIKHDQENLLPQSAIVSGNDFWPRVTFTHCKDKLLPFLHEGYCNLETDPKIIRKAL